MKKERDVLVVDDEPVITQAVSRICEAEGLSVDCAERGAAGLALLGDRSYRLIICDIMMPDVDGFKFLEQAGRLGVRAPVIMTTGYSTVENALRSLSCGAIDFIAKPFTADELLGVVRRGLKYDALQKECLAPAGTRHALPCLAYVPCPAKYDRLGYVSWTFLEERGTALMGVSDLFLKTIGDLAAIELLAVDGEVIQGETCATITSADGAEHAVMCPISGRIVAVNVDAVAQPPIIEKDPYFAGWLYRVLPCDPAADLQHLSSCSSDRI
jgi:CheY-like chemotaxis protein